MHFFALRNAISAVFRDASILRHTAHFRRFFSGSKVRSGHESWRSRRQSPDCPDCQKFRNFSIFSIFRDFAKIRKFSIFFDFLWFGMYPTQTTRIATFRNFWHFCGFCRFCRFLQIFGFFRISQKSQLFEFWEQILTCPESCCQNMSAGTTFVTLQTRVWVSKSFQLLRTCSIRKLIVSSCQRTVVLECCASNFFEFLRRQKIEKIYLFGHNHLSNCWLVYAVGSLRPNAHHDTCKMVRFFDEQKNYH